MEFTILPARLELEALEEIALPPGGELNTFRGALGHALRSVACKPECREAKNCPIRQSCAYARFFEPIWENGPSGYHEAPRPFVLRRANDTLRGGLKGALLQADLFVFDRDHPPWAELHAAFERVAAQGLGPSRSRARLNTFTFSNNDDISALRLPVNAPPQDCGRRGSVRISFATPTELKSGGEVLTQPDFAALTHRLVDRLWALGCLYQGWQPADWDYHALLATGRAVQLTDWNWRHADAERKSSRTGQRHSIGGFTGWAEYEGPIGAFLPILKIAQWIGVGRQTVWGKGELRLESVKWHDET